MIMDIRAQVHRKSGSIMGGIGRALVVLCTSAILAQEVTEESRAETSVIQLDETIVSGNQELPKVLYIVPWQQPDGVPDFQLSPQLSDLRILRRLYPPAYRRELKYYQLLKASSTEK